jgi:DNA-binding transcriptional ArsR family regulator
MRNCRSMAKSTKLSRKDLGTVAENFKALSEPTRLAILQELKAGPLSVNALAEAVGLSQANVSKQLRILYDAGFLSREQRGTQVIYAIGDEMVMQLCALVCDRLNRKAKASLRTYAI